jgi:hypothetical protein
MSALRDTFDDLKSSILGTTTAKIDVKLDTAFKDIMAYKSRSGRNGYIDLVKRVIGATTDVKIATATGQGVFGSTASPASMGQGSRLLRYKTYEGIVSNINYCFRALSVLVDCILSPDDITKVSLEIKPVDFLEDQATSEMTSYMTIVKNTVKKLKLEQKLDLIVRNTLQYGDFFCEIADPKTAILSRTVLAEGLQERSILYETYLHQQIEKGIVDKISVNEKIDINKKARQITEVSIDYSSLVSDEDKQESAEERKNREELMKQGKCDLKNIHLVFHNPKMVVKLQSSLFPVCFGYLIFPPIAVNPGLIFQEDPVNNICKAILSSLEKKLPQMKEFDNQEDIAELIHYMIQKATYRQTIDIRYVPPSKMVHFNIPSTKYYPYGESIFDNSSYSAKVLIALETALAVQRLSRSTEKRKISVEVGLPRDARKAIEGLKEEFRKRKISLDSFGSVDTIPSMITTFEDIYIPQKDGKPYVDISSFNEGNVDARQKAEELKFFRDQLTAGYGVPPSFLNIEENLSNKAALSEENILFARTVIGHQKYLTLQIQDLIVKVLEVVNPGVALDLLDRVIIMFPTPRSLQYEREARYMTELANLVETLDRIGIPKQYSRIKYLSQIDWKEVKKYEINKDIETELDPEKKQEEQMGIAGGGLGLPPTVY